MVGVLSRLRLLASRLSFWWTNRLFPGTADRPASRTPFPTLPAFSLLLILSGLLFLTQLQAPLLEPQEPRYAEVSREMLAEGSWLVPILHDEPYLDKPPLFYWLIMASYRLFGVHDWAARLVPGLAGVLTVMVTYLWGRAVVGERKAFWGALILCLSARFVYLERLLTFDSVLCLTVTAGLAAAHRAVCSHATLRWSWWLLSAVACGFGVLTKGPVAMALIMVPVLLYQSIDARCPRPTLASVAAYLGAAGLVAAPWFIALMVLRPGFAGHFFWTHNVVRFIAPFDHEEPFWFHLPGLVFGMLPWSLLVPGLLMFLVRRSRRAAARRSPALGYFLLAGLWGVLFFSLSGCKRSVYIVPAVPPLALALGYYLSQLRPTFTWRLRRGQSAGLASLVLLLLSLAAVVIAANNQLITPTCAILLAVVLVGILPLLWLAPFRSWPACAVLTFGLLFGGLQLILPSYNRQFALREQLQAHSRQTQGSLRIVFCYPQCWDSVGFYLPDAEVKVFLAGTQAQLLRELTASPGALLLVRAGRWQQELVRRMPDTLEYVPGDWQGSVIAGWVRKRGEKTIRKP
jgi:4-amino-4-deoxy-L-arabinose transferase-like glycosyltransferase